MTAGRNSSRWRSWLLPVALVLAAFVLRGAYYRGSYGHPDETITLEVVKYLQQSGDWDTNWRKSAVRELFHYDQYNFSSYLYAVFAFEQVVKVVPGLKEWSDIFGGYWVARYFSVLLGTLAVWQTWWLGRRLAGDLAGIAAGLLAAVAPILVQDSHYARPEAFVTVLTLWAVALVLFPSGHWRRRVFGSAVVLGVLVACKISLLLIAWLPFVALWDEPPRLATWVRAVSLALAGLALGFFVGAPGAVIHPAEFFYGVEQLILQYGGIQSLHSYPEGGPVAGMQCAYFIATLGWPALLGGAAGLGVLLARRAWRPAVVVAGPLILFAGYFATRTVFFERNLSHVVPLGCVLAGMGIAALVKWLAPRLPQLAPVSVLALLAVLVVQPAQISYRLVWVEFSGRRGARREHYEQELRHAYAFATWGEVAPLDDQPLRVLARHFAAGGPPLLLRVADTQDAWSAPFAGHLLAKFDAVKVGDWPSTFAELPFSTLFTYVSPHLGYYLVRGKRAP